MASAFDNYFAAAAAPGFTDLHGEPVTYTPNGGTAFNTKGPWDAQSFLNVSPDPRGRLEKTDGRLSIEKAIFAAQGVEPKEADSVRLNSKNYAVVDIQEDGVFYVLTLSAQTYSDRSDGGLRRATR